MAIRLVLIHAKIQFVFSFYFNVNIHSVNESWILSFRGVILLLAVSSKTFVSFFSVRSKRAHDWLGQLLNLFQYELFIVHIAREHRFIFGYFMLFGYFTNSKYRKKSFRWTQRRRAQHKSRAANKYLFVSLSFCKEWLDFIHFRCCLSERVFVVCTLIMWNYVTECQRSIRCCRMLMMLIRVFRLCSLHTWYRLQARRADVHTMRCDHQP